ncbi:non-canonical purine NTP pyrophosphatase [Weissella minor]|uniref:non-canonical purine NTP pyrophosphatase n=1 Tax=Weissella minor TaxID=1620 RepID=UPI003AF2BACB
MVKRLVIASNNTHKTQEIAEFFALFDQKVVNYRELHAEIQFPTETVDNMQANVKAKAEAIQHILPDEYILADDSALFIPALPDHFGVTTMREFKAHALKSDEAINQYILDLTDTVTDRSGYLQSDFLLLTPTGKQYPVQAQGGIAIANVPRGINGIDAIMETPTGKTLGEMSVSERVDYAARGKAAKAIVMYLNKEDKGEIRLCH